MTTTTPTEWNDRYLQGDVPWDSGVPSRELIRVLDEDGIGPCRAVELGCGTGTNAVFLASKGFDVTGLDFASTAIERARKKAEDAGVKIRFEEADVRDFTMPLAPFDFLFDRGCYHCVRRIDLPGYLKTVARLTKEGTRFLLLTGNANEQKEGPPRLHEHEIRADLESLFRIDRIREFRFDAPNEPEAFLGWSCLMTRRRA